MNCKINSVVLQFIFLSVVLRSYETKDWDKFIFQRKEIEKSTKDLTDILPCEVFFFFFGQAKRKDQVVRILMIPFRNLHLLEQRRLSCLCRSLKHPVIAGRLSTDRLHIHIQSSTNELF